MVSMSGERRLPGGIVREEILVSEREWARCPTPMSSACHAMLS